MNNPQAFPQELGASSYKECRGMTLLDYFAGQALIGLLVHQDYISKGCVEAVAEDLAKNKKYTFTHGKITARAAYHYAEEMLKARGTTLQSEQ